MRTHKPVAQMTAAEKTRLADYMRAKGYFNDDDFPGVLGNKNSFTIARPLRRRKPVARRKATG